MKLVSKYNKQKGMDVGKADATDIANIISNALNERLENEESVSCGSVGAEVSKFEAVKGFLNIYLRNA